MSCAAVIEFQLADPRQNLPPHLARKRGESNFVAAFRRTYAENQGAGGIYARRFALSGYGIPDLVWMQPTHHISKTPASHDAVLTAFEMKLRDWKKALSQAHRYRYFSDFSIVVLPEAAIGRARDHVELFKHLGIGLWAFNPKTQALTECFTPRHTKAKNLGARTEAVSRILGKLKLRKTRK